MIHMKVINAKDVEMDMHSKKMKENYVKILNLLRNIIQMILVSVIINATIQVKAESVIVENVNLILLMD